VQNKTCIGYANAGMLHGPLRTASRSLIIGVMLLPPSAGADKVLVADELERLSEAHGFRVIGLEAVEDGMGRAEGDELLPRLRRLLESFDHVIVQSPQGGVERVIVLGEKVPFVPPPRSAAKESEEDESETEDGGIVLGTERRGTQHAVEVSLEGPGGKRMSRSLLIDTGADFVVLPTSLVSDLGMPADALDERDMQTANGKVKARVGTLPALWLGRERVPEVVAAFIDDDKLGNGGLLGMSVLSRYTMTIDDDASRLTLAAKGTGGQAPSNGDAGEDGVTSPDQESGQPDE
jgi:clan AA aspartic protease (TIGR02281 family)